jgi:protein O-GlcNAc transferase
MTETDNFKRDRPENVSPRVVFVCATRASRAGFEQQALLAQCLPRLRRCSNVALRVSLENTAPLGEVYNAAIETADAADVLVFVHDDVHLDDWMAVQHLMEALNHFDIVGVAGNQRRMLGQLAWYLQAPRRDELGVLRHDTWDHPHLSGAVAHGSAPGMSAVSLYGPAPRAVRLLDGLFIAARAQTLLRSGLRFDPALGFHLYDLDFCRSAEAKGLKIGTWPIAVTHASTGASIRSTAWAQAQAVYRDKWHEPGPSFQG